MINTKLEVMQDFIWQEEPDAELPMTTKQLLQRNEGNELLSDLRSSIFSDSKINESQAMPEYLKAIEKQRQVQISKQKKRNKFNVFNKKRDSSNKNASAAGSEHWMLSDLGSDTNSLHSGTSDISLGIF